ncbi:MAG: hypothetical protein ACI8QT_001781 [Halioglobus sp.]|jgi:hypothetical protein
MEQETMASNLPDISAKFAVFEHVDVMPIKEKKGRKVHSKRKSGYLRKQHERGRARDRDNDWADD